MRASSWIAVFLFLSIYAVRAQRPMAKPVQGADVVETYVNPVLPGDHPDPTLLKVGKDFYHCGSSFHFTPYLPVYHSTDLVHWELIGRVVQPAVAGWVADRPSGGIWQGAITRFYGSYWIYFSSNGQWFCKADSPRGPWSPPVQVRTNPATGNLGYDNSIFIDDDGKPYMVIKNGQRVNRIQALGRDGQLTDTVINLDWINANLQYSWAEGPVMCKRNGFYYYFPAGDVSGGQYVLRTRSLTSDSTKWERLGNFFKPITDPDARFRVPNHISAPVQLEDGSWWCLGQSYERLPGDDWSGMGRQTSLFRVIWEGDRPWGLAPTSQPQPKPDLPNSGIPWRTVRSDYFDAGGERDTLNACWHFLSRRAAARYSLSARPGWLRLSPDSGRTHIVQKETDHYYSAITKVDLNASDAATKAGIYLTNGNEKVVVRLYTGYDEGKRIVFQLDTAIRSVINPSGNIVWLRLERREHELTAACSRDGKDWVSLGAPISSVPLDKVQPNFNSWVGTSLGLFAEGQPADFDEFVYKSGFTPVPAAGYSNYYGIERKSGRVAANTPANGGWFMLAGVDLGKPLVHGGDPGAKDKLELTIRAASAGGGDIEVWLDELGKGAPIARIHIPDTGGPDRFNQYRTGIAGLSGQHDLFIRYPATKNTIYVDSICFGLK